MTPQTRDDLLELFRWSIEMGADEFVDDIPHNWLEGAQFSSESVFSLSDRDGHKDGGNLPPREKPYMASHSTFTNHKSAAFKENIRREPIQSSFVSLEKAIQFTKESLANVHTLEELKDALQKFDGCPLKKTAKNLCFYRGSPKANLMIIGEAPGRDEDIEGSPFVGRAGQLLDRMLATIGCDEKDVHITNVVYWRPPGNRTPTSQETESCRPFLEKQISLVTPSMLLLLGSSAAKQILLKEDGILRLRGRWFETKMDGRTIPTLASLHPAYLLRTPSAKKFSWRDLLLTKQFLFQSKTP